MSDAHLFAQWLFQGKKSDLDADTIEKFAYAEVDHMPVHDLIAVLYYGRSGHAMVALNALKRHFFDEMSLIDDMLPKEMR